jgi:hypothetical protein
MPCLEVLVSLLASMRHPGIQLTLVPAHGVGLGEKRPSDIMSIKQRVKIRITNFRSIVLDGKSGSSAKEDEVVPIRAIGPVVYRLLDLEHVVRDDPGCGGFPLPLCSQDRPKCIDDLVRSGVFRSSI